MTRPPVKDWHPTGWRGASTIEFKLKLADGGRAAVWKGAKSKLWNLSVGDSWRIVGRRYRTADAAKRAAEKELRLRVQAALRLLGGAKP